MPTGYPRAKEEADAQPAAKPKTGRYEALVNLSIGRADSKDKGADIVRKGEVVQLTEEQAQGFLKGHKRPVIREARDQNKDAPDIKAKDLFGAKGRPQGAQFGAREDPPGSSAVTQHDPSDPANHPEANDPDGSDMSIDPDAAKDK